MFFVSRKLKVKETPHRLGRAHVATRLIPGDFVFESYLQSPPIRPFVNILVHIFNRLDRSTDLDIDVSLEQTGEKRIIRNVPLICEIEAIPPAYFCTVNH